MTKYQTGTTYLASVVFALLSLFTTAQAQCNDLRFEITNNVLNFTCTQQPITFYNQNNFPIDSVKSFRWNFGDGSVINGSSTNNTNQWHDGTGKIPEHSYKTDGLYNASFSVEHLNGYKDTTFLTIWVKSTMELRQLDSAYCNTDTVYFDLDIMDYRDSGVIWPFRRLDFIDATRRFRTIGKAWSEIYSLNVSNNSNIIAWPYFRTGCPDLIDTLEFHGKKAEITLDKSIFALDRSEKYQCDANAAVNFKQATSVPNSFRSITLWDFGDDYCLPCTTNTALNLNVGMNCRYSQDEFPSHSYTKIDSIYDIYFSVNKPIDYGSVGLGIYEIKSADTTNPALYRAMFNAHIIKPYKVILSVTDSISGCQVIDSTYITIDKPDADKAIVRNHIVAPFGTRYDYPDFANTLYLDRSKNNQPFGEYEINSNETDNKWETVRNIGDLHSWLDGNYTKASKQTIAIANKYPKEVVTIKNRDKLKRGVNNEKVGLIAHQGLDNKGNQRCPDTAWVDLQSEIFDPELAYWKVKNDSLKFKFNRINQRPSEWSLFTSGLGYSEKFLRFVPTSTGKGLFKSQLTTQLLSWLEDSLTIVTDTITTATYERKAELDITKLPFSVLKKFEDLKIDIWQTDHAEVIDAMGIGQNKIDTMGIGAIIEEAITYKAVNVKRLDPRDTSIVSATGSEYSLHYPNSQRIVFSGCCRTKRDEDDLINVTMYPNGELKRGEQAWYFNSKKHIGKIVDHVNYCNQLSNPENKYGRYLVSGNKPLLSDSIILPIRVYSFYDSLVSNFNSTLNLRLRKEEGLPPIHSNLYDIKIDSFGTLKQIWCPSDLINTDKNWLMEPGNTIYVDWDVDDMIDERDTLYALKNSVAHFSHFPTKGGRFTGAIVSQSKYGYIHHNSFNYVVEQVKDSEFEENLSTSWEIGSSCAYILGIKNSSRIYRIDECGIEIYNDDSMKHVRYIWGDGTDTLVKVHDSVSHKYTAGIYELIIIYESKYGYVDTTKHSFELKSHKPDIHFDCNALNDTLFLIGPSIADSMSYNWDFGDGYSSKLKDPKHLYSKDTVHKVCLTIENSSVSCSITECKDVNPMSCNASFMAVKDTFNQFGVWVIDKSSGKDLRYIWDFGDGDTSHHQYPEHVYGTFGKYLVCQSVYNSVCKSEYCDSVGMDANGKILKKEGFSISMHHSDKLGVKPIVNQGIGFRLIPNPANERVKIDIIGLSRPNISSITIINSLGQKVRETSHLPSGNMVDVHNLNSGNYFIIVCLTNGKVVHLNLLIN